MKRQWQEKEEFPPYEFALDAGKEMFATPFKNGKTYADCFPNGGIGIRQNYPYFDTGEGKVVTLELALNRCREANGEAPYSYVKDEMASLTAYMSTPDLVIRGGTVADGSGGELFEADVAISRGRISEVGKVSAKGQEEIDARGKLVTPGFVDVHTHYDGQVTWSQDITPSSQNGVTTAIMTALAISS